MSKYRLETFTDGVMAILITVMVLELKVPESSTSLEIVELIRSLLIYLLSFIYMGMYWSNHHHLFGTVKKINSKIIINNLVLLFFVSLIPFATKWITNDMGTISLVFYGICLITSAISYSLLVKSIIKGGNDITQKIYDSSKYKKEVTTIAIICIGILFAFISYPISFILYGIVAAMWVFPDRKLEEYFQNNEEVK